MAGFDGSGPRGMGPMTGRGRGYCIVALKDTSSPELPNKSSAGSLEARDESYLGKALRCRNRFYCSGGRKFAGRKRGCCLGLFS